MNTFQRLKKTGSRLIAVLSFLLAFQGIIAASSANASCVSSEQIASITSGSGTYITCGGDDISYRIPISGTVVFGGVTYSDIYATTNSVISFGSDDDTYDEFPSTPSISLGARDWVVDGFVRSNGSSSNRTNIPNERSDEFMTITINGDTFIVDISARQYGDDDDDDLRYDNPAGYYYSSDEITPPSGSPTRMVLSFVRNANGELRIRAFNSNDVESPYSRSGCVLTEDADPITLEECGIFEVTSVEAVVQEVVQEVVKVNSLAATSPLVISQTKEAVICTGADLNYMVQGVQAVTPTLTTQTFSLSVDGVVVAHKQTLDSSASFDKRLLPTSGVATCSQEATQGGSQVTIRSEVSGALAEAEKSRQIAVAKIKSDFKIHSQSLNSSKPEKSSFESAVAYYAASKEWRSGLLAAQKERDTAIRAAQIIEMDTAYTIGMKVDLRP